MKVIAIDAGASKTRVILKNTIKPTEYREKILEPCNYVIHGWNGTKELAVSILTKFKIKSPGKYYVIAGIAGVVTTSSKNRVQKIFQSYGFSSDRITIYNDAELLLQSIGYDGIILIAGTGAICIGRKKLEDGNYREAKAGGYGYRFNTEPGGYSLGIKAIQKCLEIENGISKIKSSLPERIKDHFNIKPIRELIPLIYESKEVQKKIAAIAPIIIESANNNDSIAVNLLKYHTNSLASYIRTVYRKLGLEKSTVYLHGGLFKNRYSKEFLINPIMNHKSLKKLNIKFKTLGVKKSDKDPLIEAIKTITF